MDSQNLGCESCKVRACRTDGSYPSFCISEQLSEEKKREVLQYYQTHDEELKIMRVAAEIEGQYYGKMTRVEETVTFLKKMGYRKVGIATCVGLLNETAAFCKLLRSHGISYVTAGCKLGAVDKREVGIPNDNRLNPESPHESMCNPIQQAEYLKEQGTDFNLVIGLCVGHDVLFNTHSHAPASTMIVKDRVTCHNPAAPLHHLDGFYKKLLGDR